jgi:hypothetical protein
MIEYAQTAAASSPSSTGSASRDPDLERQLGVSLAGHVDHARRKVDADHIGAEAGQVRRDVPGPTADVGEETAAGKVGEAGQERPIERLAGQLAADLVGIARCDRVVAGSGRLAGRGPAAGIGRQIIHGDKRRRRARPRNSGDRRPPVIRVVSPDPIRP